MTWTYAGCQLKAGQMPGLTVRPEPFGCAQESLVEGWTVKPFMVRQGSPEFIEGLTTNGLTSNCPALSW